MFKGFDFYIVIWKKPKFRLPRLKYEKLYSQANQKPPTFYIYIEIYIWRIINVWWVIITHLNWISFSEHLFFFVPVSQSVLSIDTCLSVHLLILLSLLQILKLPNKFHNQPGGRCKFCDVICITNALISVVITKYVINYNNNRISHLLPVLTG